MKKFILLTMVSGSCLMAAAQMPDTSRQQQWNNSNPPDTTMQQQWNSDNRPDSMIPQPQWNNGNRPDSTNINLQVTPMETAPSSAGTPDTMNISTPQPVNTDVRNTDPLADSVNMRSATEPAATENNTSVTTPAAITTGDSATATTRAMPAETVPAEGNLSTTQSASTGNMPRGVNIPEASTLLTGLGKWSSLPVLNTFVPEEVVNKLKAEHGEKLYDITMLKTGENQYAYSARVQENGIYSTVIVQGDTVAVTQ
jgi:hypothetical protein